MTKTLRGFLERERTRALIAPHIYNGLVQYYGDIVDEVCGLENVAQIDAADRTSLVAALQKAVSWPITIGAKDGSALLVRPNHDIPDARPNVIAMQKARGKIRLLKQFGGMEWFNAKPVFEHEHFVAHQGSAPQVDHIERALEKHKRGRLVGAYAEAITRKSLPRTLVVLHRSDIDAIREEYSTDWAEGDLDTIEWYAVKTAVHKLCESITLPEMARRLLDDGGQSSRFAAPVAGAITVPVADPKGVVDSVMKPAPIVDPLAVMQNAQVGGVAA